MKQIREATEESKEEEDEEQLKIEDVKDEDEETPQEGSRSQVPATVTRDRESSFSGKDNLPKTNPDVAEKQEEVA